MENIKMTNKQDVNDQLQAILTAEETNKQNTRVQHHLDALKQLREQAYKIEVEVLDGGKLPAKANRTDAGFDVYATEDVTIFPGQVVKHPLNIRMKLPAGSWAEIQTKSGLGSKGMLVYAGVVDEGYRGIPHVIATNLNWNLEWEPKQDGGFEPKASQANNIKPIIVKKNEKLAQITMHPHSNEYFMIQVESVDTETDRGTGGFGSSGVK
jgi:dUTP pyrophosphatase